MGSCDGLEAISLDELFADVLSECVAGTAGRHTPARFLLFGVRPNQVAHGALMRNFGDSIDLFNLVQGVDAGRETSVQAENLVLNHSSQRQVVEEISQVLPNVSVAVLAHALVVKPINLRDLSALVVASEDADAVFVANLEAEKQGDRLH